MPQVGPLEILIVGVLALLVFGPERLPEIGRSVGKAMHQMKRMASDVRSEFDLGLEEEKRNDESPADTNAPAPIADAAPAGGVDRDSTSGSTAVTARR